MTQHGDNRGRSGQGDTCDTARAEGSSGDTPAPFPAPSSWLYVSKRLDLEYLPNVPLWSAPVITFGATAYYRLTPPVLVWLEAAGAALERQYLAGLDPRHPAYRDPDDPTAPPVGLDQVNEYLAAMQRVYTFANATLPADQVNTLRSLPPALPEVPRVPIR